MKLVSVLHQLKTTQDSRNSKWHGRTELKCSDFRRLSRWDEAKGVRWLTLQNKFSLGYSFNLQWNIFSLFLVWAKRCHTSFEASWWPLPPMCRDFRRSYSESCGEPIDKQFIPLSLFIPTIVSWAQYARRKFEYLSAFDVIGSKAREIAGDDVVTIVNEKSCPSEHCNFKSRT